MGVDAVQQQHIQGVDNIPLVHERLQTQYDFLGFCLGLIQLISIQEKDLSLSFLLFEFLVDLFLQTMRLLLHAPLYGVGLGVCGILTLLKGWLSLGLWLPCDCCVDFHDLPRMSAD